MVENTKTSSKIDTLKRDDRVPALDGIRGIAILLVMLDHFTLFGGMQPNNVVDRLFYDAAVSGWIGVDLFFVLSGFLITGILLDTKTNKHFFRNFYLRRCLRIFPLYYGTLFVFFVALPRIVSVSQQYQQLINTQAWYWSYLVNLLIALEDWPAFAIIGHFWSLAIEEQFYFFWPIIIFLFQRRNLLIICVLCIIASFGVRMGLALTGHSTAATVLTPARMDGLALGALLAAVAREPNGLSRLSLWAWPTAGATGLGLIAIVVWRRALSSDDRVVQVIGYTLVVLLFGAMLTVAVTSHPETAPGKVFASPGLVFFGRYSYALYVFHQPLVFLLEKHVISVGRLPRLMGLQLPGQILFIIIATGISVSLALLSWHFYEQPCLKLKNLFPYHTNTTLSLGFKAGLPGPAAPEPPLGWGASGGGPTAGTPASVDVAGRGPSIPPELTK